MAREQYSEEQTSQAQESVNRLVNFVQSGFDTSHIAGGLFLDSLLIHLFGDQTFLEMTGDDHWRGNSKIRGVLEEAWLRSGDFGMMKEFERCFVSGAEREGIEPASSAIAIAERMMQEYLESLKK